MKLIASGVTFSAASIRSPSFSRSSSSTRTIIRPARISSIALGTSVNGAFGSMVTQSLAKREPLAPVPLKEPAEGTAAVADAGLFRCRDLRHGLSYTLDQEERVI